MMRCLHRFTKVVAVFLTTVAMLVTSLVLVDAAGAQTVSPWPDYISNVDVGSSCLANRGRVDVTITAGRRLTSQPTNVEVVVTVGALAPRTRSLNFGGDTRVIVTGRPDGSLPVSVAIGGKTVQATTVKINCAPALSSPTVATSCLAGRGRVDVTTPAGIGYVVSFPGLTNRTIAGRQGRTGRSTWTGRRDGIYTVKAVSSAGTVTNLRATVKCSNGPEPGELAVTNSCLANRGRVDISFRTEASATYEVRVSGLKPRTHSARAGEVIRETVTGRPDGPLAIGITKGSGSSVASTSVTINCAPQTTQKLSLQGYDDCPSFLSDIKTKALEDVTAWGLDGPYLVDALPFPEDAAALPTYSETNNQVPGVDEPDLMKTNGDVLIVAESNQVRVYAIDGGTAVEKGSVTLESYVQSLFFDGTNIVAITGSGEVIFGGDALMAMDLPSFGTYKPRFTITRIPLSSSPGYALGKPTSVTFDGVYIDSRLSDGLIRLVSTSRPVLDFTQPEFPYTDESLAAAEAANRKIIQDSRVEDWLGSYQITAPDGSTTSRTISNCRDMFLPEPFSGYSSLAVTTIDPATMNVTPGPGVLTNANTVYSSGDSLYVATERWIAPGTVDTEPQVLNAPIESTHTTQIHKFDTTTLEPVYRGSGQVRGHLLNQFAMHERNGRLFVASTDGAAWWPNAEEARSYVTALAPAANGLTQVGQVGNLGAGEQIFAVRYVDDVAYVVTFRRTDPLYVVDLRDPTAPKVTGELKIPGYSAYLHPIGNGLLLGVGADADVDGRVTGAKLSLFDVRDPARPTEVTSWTAPDAHFLAENDHHAFTWWAPRNQAILPMRRNTQTGESSSTVFSVTDSKINEIGSVAASGGWSAALRSTVIGDHLWTVTPEALVGNSLDDLSQTEKIPFR